MELAAIEALEALQRPAKVTLRTGSKYLPGGITRWIKGWQLTAGRPRRGSRSRTTTWGAGWRTR
jgi:ribonuclease HI